MFEIAEHQHAATEFVERPDRLPERVQTSATVEMPRRIAMVVDLGQLVGIGGLVADAPERRHRRVVRDPQDPGPLSAGFSLLVEVLPRFDHGLLHDVLGERRIAHHSDCRAVDGGGVSVDERAEATVRPAVGNAAAPGSSSAQHNRSPGATARPALLEPSAVPSRSVASPLLVVFHGHASSPLDAGSLAERIDPDRAFHHVVPVGPVSVSGGRAWFGDQPDSLADATHTVASLLRGLCEDQGGPVFAVGYSQGAAALLAALAAPSTPAASLSGVVCISGFLPEPPEGEWHLDRLKDVPVLLQHGRGDDVVPAFLAADLAAMLSTAGVSVDHHEFDATHAPTDEMAANARVWLASLTTPAVKR